MSNNVAHGRLFDNFSAQASHAHGGSYFDAGFGQKTLSRAHGKLHDLFGVPREGSEAHGQRFDEFGWRDMPALHGQQFDSDFRQETAHDSGGHGTWFDEFRGGTQVRFLLEGADYEGTIIECTPAYAVVRSHDGQTHEVDLAQFLSYRSPTQQQVGPQLPASDAEAPSAHSADARGGGERRAVSSDMPPVIEEVPQGAAAEPRAGMPEGLMDTFQTLKALVAADDVAKDVDATQTGTQGAPAKTVGHRSNCPRGGSAPCGADVDGKCSACNESVRDHEAVGKANTGALGIEVPTREHKSTDHHSSQTKPGRCPHCGAVLDELEHQTAQGQPSRQEKDPSGGDFNATAHKCVGTGLDVLKSLVTA